jgi:hypothetical protein
VAKSKAQPDLTNTTRRKVSMIHNSEMRMAARWQSLMPARPTFVAMERTCCVVQTGDRKFLRNSTPQPWGVKRLVAIHPCEFNRDPEDIPESRRRPTLSGMQAAGIPPGCNFILDFRPGVLLRATPRLIACTPAGVRRLRQQNHSAFEIHQVVWN